MGRKRRSGILQSGVEQIIPIEKIINKRINDINLLYKSIEEESIPELKLVWEYQINLNFEIIDASMRNDKNLANIYIEEIIRSTTLSELYRKDFHEKTNPKHR